MSRQTKNRLLSLLRTTGDRPVVIAHRGDSSHAPENTLEAAEVGHAAGADAWELDVQLTRDGVAVVIHDESLLRTTDVAARFGDDPRSTRGYRVSDFDLAELLTLDAGSWFLSDEGGRRTARDFGTRAQLSPIDAARVGSGLVRVPTLLEALELTIQHDWLVNIEVKSFPDTNPAILDAVLRAVTSTNAADRVLISSFDHRDVARAAVCGQGIATGVLTSTPLHRPAEYVRSHVGADCFHPSAAVLGAESSSYRNRPTPAHLRLDDLDLLNEAGVPVVVYTVNDARPAGLGAQLAAAGVGGIFTDEPAKLLKLFGIQLN